MTAADKGEMRMEESTGNCDTDTIPIPLLDVERKTLPVKCPWCNAIAGVAKMDVMRIDKISPYYRPCDKCVDFINEGRVFLNRNSRLRRWLVSFYRQIWAFRGK